VKATSYEVPYYAVFSIPLLLLFLSLRSKYSPQHILKHHQSILFSQIHRTQAISNAESEIEGSPNMMILGIVDLKIETEGPSKRRKFTPRLHGGVTQKQDPHRHKLYFVLLDLKCKILLKMMENISFVSTGLWDSLCFM
jgi:hypothetical protein